MPFALTDDAVSLYYEVKGDGPAIVFVHEFAADHTSWKAQVEHFSGQFKCIVYNARGYPPSTVPDDPSAYSQARAVKDILAVMDHLAVEQAHVVGLSMGGFASLMFGLHHPERCLSVCVAGVGYGAELARREKFREEAQASASFIRDNGADAFARRYMSGPTRIPFRRLDPEGFNAFSNVMAGFSAVGLANTQMGVQRERPSLYDLQSELSQYSVPALIVNGDEDWPCLAPGLMLKQAMPTAGLLVYPNCGHTINLERPQALNQDLERLFMQAADGSWPSRDPASMVDSITGMDTVATNTAKSGE